MTILMLTSSSHCTSSFLHPESDSLGNGITHFLLSLTPVPIYTASNKWNSASLLSHLYFYFKSYAIGLLLTLTV